MLQRPEGEKGISFCQRSWIFFLKLVYEVNSKIFTIRAEIYYSLGWSRRPRP